MYFNYLGYGALFGPTQFGESFNASPDKYLRLAPLLHWSSESDHSDSPACTIIVFSVNIRRSISACKSNTVYVNFD